MPLFYVQALFSGTGLIFAMVQLYRGGDPGTYLPVFSSIVSYWLPSPAAAHREPPPDIETGLLDRPEMA